jgi:hypothetical protein
MSIPRPDRSSAGPQNPGTSRSAPDRARSRSAAAVIWHRYEYGVIDGASLRPRRCTSLDLIKVSLSLAMGLTTILTTI